MTDGVPGNKIELEPLSCMSERARQDVCNGCRAYCGCHSQCSDNVVREDFKLKGIVCMLKLGS